MTPTSSQPDVVRIGGESLRHVLASLLSFQATEENPIQEVAAPEGDSLMLATVALIGERASGEVRLQIPEAFARLALGVLLGAENTQSLTRPQIDDLCGELGNMIAGRVATDLARQGYCCTLGTPRIERGPRWILIEDAHHAARPTAWTCQGHRILMDVRCHFQPL